MITVLTGDFGQAPGHLQNVTLRHFSFTMLPGSPFFDAPVCYFQKVDGLANSFSNYGRKENNLSIVVTSGHKLIFPTVPSAEFRLESLPMEVNSLLQPMLKVAEKTDIHGVCSGRRSAILFAEGRYFRLKGCGDLTAGFPLADVSLRKTDALQHGPCHQIRGCMFETTVARELCMTEVIAKVFLKFLNLVPLK